LSNRKGAQARGRTHYYEDYLVVVCEEMRSYRYARRKEEEG
jgi:hypothetical protein